MFYREDLAANGYRPLATSGYLICGNDDVEYLSDGMTESLIDSLSQLPKLSVKARSSVFRYKGKEVEAQQVAADLQSVTRAGFF